MEAHRLESTINKTEYALLMCLSLSLRQSDKAESLPSLTVEEWEQVATLADRHEVLALLEDVWDISFVGETRTVDTHIQTLRRKLNEAQPGLGNHIETVRGVGYRLSKDSE